MNKLVAALGLALALSVPGIATAQHQGIDELIAGIGGSAFLEAAAKANAASSVQVVRLSTLAGAAQAADRLASVIDTKRDDIQYLQGTLSLNPMARTALNGAGVTLQQIVTVTLPSDNAAIVYANDL